MINKTRPLYRMCMKLDARLQWIHRATAVNILPDDKYITTKKRVIRTSTLRGDSATTEQLWPWVARDSHVVRGQSGGINQHQAQAQAGGTVVGTIIVIQSPTYLGSTLCIMWWGCKMPRVVQWLSLYNPHFCTIVSPVVNHCSCCLSAALYNC